MKILTSIWIIFTIFDIVTCQRWNWSVFGPKCDEYTEFQCKVSTKYTTACIPLDLKCNGVSECQDNSDEENCVVEDFSAPLRTCPRGQFMCDHECYPSEWKCDGIPDCYDNTDEQNCRVTTTTSTTTTTTTTTLPPTPRPRTCPKGDFMCRNGERCLPKAFRCDKIVDCQDSSDEQYCPDIVRTTATTTRAPTPATMRCPSMMTLCGSGERCIYNWWKCDRIVDCRDGSDEYNCSDTGKTIVFPLSKFINTWKISSRKR